MKSKKQLIKTAEKIAIFAHKGQKTRDGGAYVLHPCTVADIVDPLHIHSKLRMIAYLHDVIEDTDWTDKDLLKAGIPQVVVDAVVALSKIKGEAYDVYIARVKANYLASLVKIADMTHNMDLSRLPKIRPKDILNNQKYRKQRNILLKHVRNM